MAVRHGPVEGVTGMYDPTGPVSRPERDVGEIERLETDLRDVLELAREMENRASTLRARLLGVEVAKEGRVVADAPPDTSDPGDVERVRRVGRSVQETLERLEVELSELERL